MLKYTISVEEATKEYPQVSQVIIESLFRYANENIPVGSFLQTVIANDLQGAFARADKNNLKNLFHIVRLCYNELPGTCWGDEKTYHEWLKKRVTP